MPRSIVAAPAAEIAARATGHHEVEQVALSEGLLRHPQQAFLEAQELRESERKPRVVAERTEVAEMIGDALQLERQRTQPGRTLRQAGPGHALERLAVGPRERHAGVAGDARGESMSFEDGQFGEASLDTLVNVAKALLESQYLLANHGEPEMPRAR